MMEPILSPRGRAAIRSSATLALLLLTPGAARAYLWERVTNVQAAPPGGLRVSEIYMPPTIRIDWDPGSQPSGVSNVTYRVVRRIDSDPAVILGTTQNRYWVDSNFGALFFDRTIRYDVVVLGGESGPTMGLPPPPPDANPADIYERTVWTTSNPALIDAVPKKATASDAGTADSRYDLRYGNPTPLDFAFGSRTYRGGLFVGYASDPSRVGRSFLKFSLPALPTGSRVWAGSVNAYHVRSFADGTTTVGCQWIANESWIAATLKWTTAPAIDPAAASQTSAVAYSAGGGNVWHRWNMADAICDALVTDRLFAVALASMNETQSGWAYFARKEYKAEWAPCAVYALGAPLWLQRLTVNPTSVGGGTSVTGTLYFNGMAPAGGLTISPASSNTSIAQVPASVFVPEGSGWANFTITTSSVMQSSQVTISAHYGYTRSATLTVTP